MKPEDIADDAPLFGEGLGLDSIDALELVVLMEKYHGVKILDENLGKKVLASINTMAEYILEENSKNK
jgi:acyl carrier protein